MTISQKYRALTLRETDVEGTIHRFSGDEALYVRCLSAFLSDKTMTELNRSVRIQAWDDAFTAAHALKGVAGNMGFVPLMHAVGRLIVLIRGGRTNDVDESLTLVNSSYRDIIDGIHQFFDAENESAKGEQL